MKRSAACPSRSNPFDQDDGVTDLQDQILSILEDEEIPTEINDQIIALLAKGEQMRFEAERDLQPCSAEAVKRGCVCGWSHTHSASIDPPYEVISKHCPLHGSEDPDGDYDRMRDEPIVPFLEEDPF